MSFPVKFGKYTLIDRLAAGGMAEVFRAHLGAPGAGSKIIAIKRMLPNLSDDEDFIKLFEKEIGLASQLTHQNLVAVYDFGMIDHHYYLAMEYVHGKSLQALAAKAVKTSPLPVDFCCYVIREVCRALDYAHGFKDPVTKNYAGIVHRDISPHNVLISYGGHVKLFDFGVAKIANKESSTIGSIKGKPAYLSPEQALGKELDGRTDIFALGIVFWEILTGHRLFYADQPIVAIRKVLEAEIPRPSSINPLVPPALDEVVLKALDRDMYTRFQLSQDFGAALDEAMKTIAPGFGLEQSRAIVAANFSEAMEKENVELTAKLNGEEVQDVDSTGTMPVPGQPASTPKEPSKKKLQQQVSYNGTLVGIKAAQPSVPDFVSPPARSGTSGLAVVAGLVVAVLGAGFWYLGQQLAPPPPVHQASMPPLPPPAVKEAAPVSPLMQHTPASEAPAQAVAEAATPAAPVDKCRARKLCGLGGGSQTTYPNACALEEAKAVLAYEGACEASRSSEIKIKDLVLTESEWKQTEASDKSAIYGQSLEISLELMNMPSLEKTKLQAVLKGQGSDNASVQKVKSMITLSTAMSLGRDLPRGFYSVEVQAIGPGGQVLLTRKADQKFYLGGAEEVKAKVVDLGPKNRKKGSGTPDSQVVDESENRRIAAEMGITYEEYKRVAEQNARAQKERELFMKDRDAYEKMQQQRAPAGE
jgi:serine/threonine protein kinase